MAAGEVRKIAVTLAGNPNVGKSTLFNALTGMRQHTGNWPGKTVEITRGTVRRGEWEFCLTDLPGTYSLHGQSEDERIAGEYLASGQGDCTVVVCDGGCLERTLILALEVLECFPRVVVCVNLMDEALRRGIRVDGEALARELGVPVVLTAAGQRQGLGKLLQTVAATASGPEQLRFSREETPQDAAQAIAAVCVTREPGKNDRWRQLVDRILLSRRQGLTAMVLLLLLTVWLTVWGANYPAAFLEKVFHRGYLGISWLLQWAPEWLRGLLTDGVYATCARVLCVMLPPMAIFFPLFTLLEDVGYLPRMAFLLDHGMRLCGGCGKQALTMCMGLGCNAVGVCGCRIIESPRERLAAMLTNAMLPCNGRFPTLILLGSLFFPEAGAALVVAACVALGAAGAMAASGVLNRTVLRSRESTFVMELPPFRRPRLGQILGRSLVDRTLRIGLRALCVAAPAGALLWVLGSTPLLGKCVALLDPAGRVMGMNGALLLGFLFSLPANELMIPVVLMALTGAGSLEQAGGLGVEALTASGMTWQTAVCVMVFTLFHWPCATTLMTVHRETGSLKKTAAAFALPTAVGFVLCLALNFVLRELGG